MLNHFPLVCQQMTPGIRQHLTNVQAELRVQPVHILYTTGLSQSSLLYAVTYRLIRIQTNPLLLWQKSS